MDTSYFQFIFGLILAIVFGGAIGLEREYKKKEAGLQTYTLVALGSCLFTIIATNLFSFFSARGNINFDPGRIILAVATGIGFIGAGVIIHRQDRVEGITTAAGLWVTASIGVATGIGLYMLAFIVTLLVIFILIVFGELEKFLFKRPLTKQK